MSICFTELIWNCGDRLHLAAPPPRRQTPHPMRLNLGTYNIQDCGGFGLPQAIRAVERGNYNLMLLAETKILDAVYCCSRLVYGIVYSKATVTAVGGHRGGGVVIVSGEWAEGWISESTCYHRPDMVSCKLVSGDQQMPLIGSHLPPSTLDHLPDLK